MRAQAPPQLSNKESQSFEKDNFNVHGCAVALVEVQSLRARIGGRWWAGNRTVGSDTRYSMFDLPQRQSVSKCIFAFQSCELEVGLIELSRPFDRIIINFVFHRRQAIHVHCCQLTDVLHESFCGPVRVACGDKARISCAAYLLNLYGICFL